MTINYARIMSIFQACSFPYAVSIHLIIFSVSTLSFLKSNQRMVFFYRNNIYLIS